MGVDGKYLVAQARRAVLSYIQSGTLPQPDEHFCKTYTQECGVFVTINRDSMLRGCIGYIEPAGMLCHTVPQAAIAAATEDPRFPPLTNGELDSVIFEVTILARPRLLEEPPEYANQITVGRDGLMVKSGTKQGLLLPQVATEYGWSATEFLDNTCRKAGLQPDCWKRNDTQVWAFGGTCYTESV